MRTSRIKNSVTFIFLFLFLSMKMVGLHALAHSHDLEDSDHVLHCVICDHITVINLTPIVAPESVNFSFEIKEYVFTQDLRRYYNYIHSNAIANNSLFCRPPPALL
ncbi:hypothetical protein FNB79_00845 [Formosa sediminum]|uniref:DUF2946 domain-containing protein n=1 Tax=Formosa sediminum TaxID=2594004 RepID=A0A516GM34_9FLAO|nr:hypothetical protein [Formosa sediminum]QDO92586.1 hypothetical protein FNB79_00845 [Formosa sediminum]